MHSLRLFLEDLSLVPNLPHNLLLVQNPSFLTQMPSQEVPNQALFLNLPHNLQPSPTHNRTLNQTLKLMLTKINSPDLSLDPNLDLDQTLMPNQFSLIPKRTKEVPNPALSRLLSQDPSRRSNFNLHSLDPNLDHGP